MQEHFNENYIESDKYPKATFAIGGHTDSVGRTSTNQKISDKRANAVKKYLVKKGVDGNRLEAKGFGESAPVDSNNTRAGKANNRRVEINLNK